MRLKIGKWRGEKRKEQYEINFEYTFMDNLNN